MVSVSASSLLVDVSSGFLLTQALLHGWQIVRSSQGFGFPAAHPHLVTKNSQIKQSFEPKNDRADLLMDSTSGPSLLIGQSRSPAAEAQQPSNTLRTRALGNA